MNTKNEILTELNRLTGFGKNGVTRESETIVPTGAVGFSFAAEPAVLAMELRADHGQGHFIDQSPHFGSYMRSNGRDSQLHQRGQVDGEYRKMVWRSLNQ